MSARRLAPLGILAAAALVAAGCGSSGGSTATSGGASPLKLRADSGGQLKFDKSGLQASSGKVTIKLENPAPLSHNIAIDGVSRQGEVVGHGGISTLTADLEPGKYTYYCAVPGHRQAGMQGTLTVR